MKRLEFDVAYQVPKINLDPSYQYMRVPRCERVPVHDRQRKNRRGSERGQSKKGRGEGKRRREHIKRERT